MKSTHLLPLVLIALAVAFFLLRNKAPQQLTADEELILDAVREVYDDRPVQWISTEHNLTTWFFLTDLHELTGVGKLERLRVGHLVHRRHHHPAGMLAHAQPVLPRRQPGGLHPVELAPQLHLGERDVAIPLLKFRGGEKPAQIEIAGPVAKPAAHLHERVVHPRSAQKVADRKPFKRKSARELVPTHRDDVESAFVRHVIKRVGCVPINLFHLYPGRRFVPVSSLQCSKLEHGSGSPFASVRVSMAAPQPLNIIANRVRDARAKRKPALTQDELSGQLAALGVTIDRAGVSKIESGTRSVLDYELKALAKALGVSVGWLLGIEK